MTLSDATILVVDDEAVLRTTFALVLRQLGATVHTAANGLEALEVLAREHVNAMLTDKQMPVMDGHTLLETLSRRGASVPSILFVDGLDSENALDMVRLGVVEIVTKPLHPTRLKQLLEELLLALPQPA
jgi:two-component system chemotaxis response regulator CheY